MTMTDNANKPDWELKKRHPILIFQYEAPSIIKDIGPCQEESPYGVPV